jgi:hypothetical protein
LRAPGRAFGLIEHAEKRFGRNDGTTHPPAETKEILVAGNEISGGELRRRKCERLLTQPVYLRLLERGVA